MVDKAYISWDIFHKDTIALADRIKVLGLEIKGIVVVTRGGLIPAAIISSELNIRTMEVYNILSYTKNSNDGDIKVMAEPISAIEDLGEGWIVVDELVDTGKTYTFIKSKLPKAFFVSVYAKQPEKHNMLDLYIKEYSKERWICFPWEIDEGF